MGFTYQKVSLKELINFATQNQMILDHETLANYAKNVYGEKAHTVKTYVEWQYNDEGGTDPSLYGVHVFDVNDDELMPFPADLVINYDYFSPLAKYYLKYDNMKNRTANEIIDEKINKMRNWDADENGALHHELDEYDLPAVDGTWLVNEIPEPSQNFYIKITDPDQDE